MLRVGGQKMITAAQTVNPYLPSYEYIPDGEPHVFGDRVYIFGSHDRFGSRKYCMNDYVVWSAPLKNLSQWTSHGIAYRKDQDPGNTKGKKALWAPDVVRGADGRYYLYYGLEFVPRFGVAVADTPEGPYEFLGYIAYPDGSLLGGKPGDVFPFDPGVLVDDDGRVFVYFGFGPVKPIVAFQMDRHKLKHEGAYVIELSADMLTIAARPKVIAPTEATAAGSSFEGHAFYEASSIRRIDGTYYFVYSSFNGHELCYATSAHPDRDFTYQGILMSNGDIGYEGRAKEEALNYWANNHGGLIQIEGEWYIFYHRHTNREQVSRQAMAEPITRTPDGRFMQAEMTSAGMHNNALPGEGTYSAHIACVLRSATGAGETPYKSLRRRGRHPFFTQTGSDREGNGDQHIANLRDGAVAGFKYFDLRDTRGIRLLTRGGTGEFVVSTELDGPAIAVIPISRSQELSAVVPLPTGLSQRSALYLRYQGKGAADVRSFTLQEEK